jgi:regulator of protease activity HflC (stomatin/prohibitin superfamily)
MIVADFNKNTKISILAGVGILILLITLFSAIRFVDTGRVGVVTSFGKVTGRELSEGMSWVIPWGVNSVTEYDIKIQKEEEESAAATKDLQDVNGTVVINFQISRGKVSEIHQKIGADYNDKLITPAINEVFKAATAKFTATDLIQNRQELKADVTSQLRSRLEKYGISIEDVSITNFKFSQAFTEAIEDRQVAQQQAERAKFNLERALTDAKAQEAQAESLSAEYLQKLAIDKWDGNLPQYLGDGTVFNIPLR